MCAHAAATAHAEAHTQSIPLPRDRAASSLGITQSQQPAVGTACQAQGSPGSMGSKGVCRNSRLATLEGWIGLVEAGRPHVTCLCRCHGKTCARRCHGSRCPQDVSPHATCSSSPCAEWWHQTHPAAATVANVCADPASSAGRALVGADQVRERLPSVPLAVLRARRVRHFRRGWACQGD
jgi:hypothetical protein